MFREDDGTDSGSSKGDLREELQQRGTRSLRGRQRAVKRN